jgi:flavin reductase (DIM6/NTAB) family NADH-FMN oxidoreductase RutF
MEKTIITKNEIMALDKHDRTRLINSLPGVRAANLIGTISGSGKTNVAVFNSVMHIGADPALMGLIMRPVSVPRDTYHNIKETGYFTVNHVNEKIVQEAHQTSARYTQSEFEATGLTEEYSLLHPAPYVVQSKVKIGLKFVEEQLIRCNQTVLMIGEIVEIMVDPNMINEHGILQLDQTGSIGVGGLETYYTLTKLVELPYAKP